MSATPTQVHDAVVVGGGFYGAAIAIYLARQRGLRDVVLVEQEAALLTRASYNNQARIHNGYHYPRSFTTAYRSRVNMPKFLREWPEAVHRDFIKVYAIARRNSKVTARQFKRFCTEIGARIQPADHALRTLFEPRLVEDVFVVEEHAFDAGELARWALVELIESGVQVRLDTRVADIVVVADEGLGLVIDASSPDAPAMVGRYVFNCTYSGLNQLGGDFPGTRVSLKHELTEMALMDTPPALRGLGLTLMDGPFFSLMPFPARGLHTLSHVRFTPHSHWHDSPGNDPYGILRRYDRATRVDRMIRDVERYLPAIRDARYVESMFEIKTLLQKNESDDGRPILFEKHASLPGCYSVLGGKIDNIYDVFEKLDAEMFSGVVRAQSRGAVNG